MNEDEFKTRFKDVKTSADAIKTIEDKKIADKLEAWRSLFKGAKTSADAITRVVANDLTDYRLATGCPQKATVYNPILKEAAKQGLLDFKVGDLAYSRSIFMPHGLGNEEAGFWHTWKKTKDPTGSHLYDVEGLLAPGQYFYDKALEVHPNCEAKFKMVGWPKSDILFSPNAKNITVNIRNGLDLKFDRTILWADDYLVLPLETHVYSMRNPQRASVLKHVISVTENMDVNLIIKPHIWGSTPGGPSAGTFDVRKEDCKSHVKWINPCEWFDVTTLFLVSDMLLCESSTSVATEFMITNKPILVFDNSEAGPNRVSAYTYDGIRDGKDIFSPNEFPVINTTGFLPGVPRGNLQHLKGDIERCLADDTGLQNLRQKHVAKIVHKPDGHAAERAVEAIKEIKELTT